MFTKIVVAVDGSDHAQKAIRAACDIAKHYTAEVHLVHTPQMDTAAFAIGASAYAIEASMEQVADAGKKVMKAAKDLCAECGTTPTSSYIGHGVPADEVISIAKAKSADLIVCGRRGLGNLTAMLLGSTSAQIAHDADCAVLTVK